VAWTLAGVLTLSLTSLTACSDDAAFTDNVDGEGSNEAGNASSSGGEEGASDDGGDPGSGGAEGDGDGDIEPGQLTAGEWRDLDHWDFWLELGAQGSPWLPQFERWGFDTRARIPVRALAGTTPVVDAAVELRDADDTLVWAARTDNHGDAELWPALLGAQPSWPLTIEAGGEAVTLDELPDGFDPVVLELPANERVDLDLMFVVDTTGSMADELAYLTVELGDVIAQVEGELGEGIGLRLSVNFYRDVGDDYVVRSFPFTTDIDTALAQLAAQTADGGGDTPEAVHSALTDGIDDHDWSDQARARLLFLVLDAPPHDTPEIRAQLAATIRSAAAQGIRVIPLAASGTDKDTEFLLRSIDIATGATYTFLTDHSGIGDPHLEPTVGDYDVELLNALLVRLIVESMD
jgi:hypothetical protein